jgi:phage protein D
VDGTPVGREHQLLSVSVTKVVNRIASARLVYVDGSASSSDFPLSNGALFVPGKTIEVSGGAVDSPRALFTGVVVRHAIKVRDNAASQLIVECRHRATRLTVGERNAYHLDQTDSDAIAASSARASRATSSPRPESTSSMFSSAVRIGITCSRAPRRMASWCSRTTRRCASQHRA